MQRQKGLEKMLTESYAQNRTLRDRMSSLFETMGLSRGSEPGRNKTPHPLFTSRHKTNEWGETWEDIIAFFNNKSNGIKRTKQAAVSHQCDVGQQSLDLVVSKWA